MAEGVTLTIDFRNRQEEPRLVQMVKDLLEECLGTGYPHKVTFAEKVDPMELARKIEIHISPTSTEADILKQYIAGVGYEEILEVTTE